MIRTNLMHIAPFRRAFYTKNTKEENIFKLIVKEVNMEKLGRYFYKILHEKEKNKWYYEIYKENTTHQYVVSTELFVLSGIARYAAIGHISLLETENQFNCSESVHF